MEPLDLEAYRDLFSSIDSMIWLAHAGVSPISRPVAEAVADHTRKVQTHAAYHIPEWLDDLKTTKQLAGDLIGAVGSDIAVTPNTTHGINLIAHGMRWRPGDQVVLATKEYPANVYPWWAQQAHGVELVWVEPDQDDRLPVEAYEATITDRTRVVTVSHVQFASGYRHDLARLGTLCKQAGAVLVVDAIQAFSVFEIDVQAWQIDALTTGAHKWLCGPAGSALFYTTPELRDRLEFTWVGADSVVDARNYLDYRFELQPDASRFENAMLNWAGLAGVRAALEVVHAVGRETIQTRIRRATDRFVEALTDLGFHLHSSRRDGEWSGIVSARHPDVDSDSLMENLKADRIATTVRDGRLRLAPHAYHTDEAIEQACQALARHVGD